MSICSYYRRIIVRWLTYVAFDGIFILMIDPEELDLTEVRMHIPPGDVTALMGHLSIYAIDHDIYADASYPPHQIDSLSETKDKVYNPDMVTWLPDEEIGEDIAVITPKNFVDYARTRAGFTNTATRFMRAIQNLNSDTRRSHPTDADTLQQWQGYLYGDFDEGTCIRAANATELANKLQKAEIAKPPFLVGKHAIELFSQFCGDLYIDLSETAE